MAGTLPPVTLRGPLPDGNYAQGRAGQRIQGIVIHTMVGTLESADATFHDPNRGASAHYGVSYQGGAIYQWVFLEDTAYHCGRLSPDAAHPLSNQTTIGIEHDDNGQPTSPRPAGLYLASGALIAELAHHYGFPIDAAHIAPHRAVSINPTACPDTLDVSRLIAVASGLVDTIASDPAAVVWRGLIHLFARKDDGACWHRYYDPTAVAWSPWESLGGTITGAPAVVGTDTDLHVFARGTDGQAWHTYFNLAANRWSPWSLQ